MTIPLPKLADCQHTQIRTWFFDDTREPAGMWSCVNCGRKFEPVNLERDADAERYRWLRMKTAGLRDNEARPYFSFPSKFGLPPVTDIMRGSVGQHLDAAIDAARKGEG